MPVYKFAARVAGLAKVVREGLIKFGLKGAAIAELEAVAFDCLTGAFLYELYALGFVVFLI